MWRADRLEDRKSVFYILERVRDKGTLDSKGHRARQCFSGALQGVGGKAVLSSSALPLEACVCQARDELLLSPSPGQLPLGEAST